MFKDCKNRGAVFLLTLLLSLFPQISKASAVAEVVTGNDENGCFVTLDLSEKPEYRAFVLANPSRLVVDLDIPDQHSDIKQISKCDYIKNIRYARFDKNWYRFVFDLSRDIAISSHNIEKKGKKSGHRFMAFISVDGTPKKLKAIDSLASEEMENLEDVKSTTNLKQKVAEEKAEKKSLEAEPSKQVTKKVSAKETTKSVEKPAVKKKQVKPIVVIDPGHGGIDPGAIGQSGAFEKVVVLEYAQALKAALQKTGKYRVRMTRQGDNFVKLEDRLNKARELEADLFISLHADAAPERSARGLSVYTLSEKAADKLAETLANKTNKGDIIEGVDLTGKSPEVAGILIDLAQRENMNKSAEFANSVITSLVSRGIKLLNNTHRFAGYVVLKSADVPAVLVELGFLSSPYDEELLESKSYKKKVTDGVVKAIDVYFKDNPVYDN